jgi:6-phosphogluconolactonase
MPPYNHAAAMRRRPAQPDIYGLERAAPHPPDLPPAGSEVVVAPTIDELIDHLAADLVVHALNCVREFGDFHLALSGGSAPQPLYERLMYDPNYRRLPWRRTHLWIVDEPRVPFSDNRSSFRAISETIVDHADIPREQVHPIYPLADDADVRYERELREVLAWREKGQDRLDYALLSVEAIGGLAGLPPHNAALRDSHRLVGICDEPGGRPGVQPPRVTMTLRLVNSARLIAVLATGASAAATIVRIAEGGHPTDELPVLGISPLNGEMKWYLDVAACGE